MLDVRAETSSDTSWSCQSAADSIIRPRRTVASKVEDSSLFKVKA